MPADILDDISEQFRREVSGRDSFLWQRREGCPGGCKPGANRVGCIAHNSAAHSATMDIYMPNADDAARPSQMFCASGEETTAP